MSPACPFCDIPPERIVAESELCVAIRDAYPVTEGHTLIITRRHVESWFDTTDGERLEMLRMDDELAGTQGADGHNLGLNVGQAAGQTIPHVHLHIIPRRDGDVDDPTGGVRNVIPGKGNYRK